MNNNWNGYNLCGAIRIGRLGDLRAAGADPEEISLLAGRQANFRSVYETLYLDILNVEHENLLIFHFFLFFVIVTVYVQASFKQSK